MIFAPRLTGIFTRSAATLAFVALGGQCSAADSASDAPAATATPNVLCATRVRFAERLPGTESVYAFGLTRPASANHDSTATGTLRVYGGTQAFDVRFMDVRIAALGNAVHPIVYRFPPGFTVESAYVATLGRQHCMIFSPWVSPYIVLQPPTEAERAAFVETATQSDVSDAGESTLVTAPACAHPNGAAEVVHPAMPDYPFAAARMEQTGTAQIFVWVLPNGAVANSGIYKSSGVASLDSSSLVAATQSTYKAQIYRCEAVAGEYLFRVEYRAR